MEHQCSTLRRTPGVWTELLWRLCSTSQAPKNKTSCNFDGFITETSDESNRTEIWFFEKYTARPLSHLFRTCGKQRVMGEYPRGLAMARLRGFSYKNASS